MTAVLVVHGPNLTRLGRREPEIYGRTTLAEIDARLAGFAADCGIELDTFQSDAEHELVARIHAAADEGVDWIVINPAGLTHTSVVLRDALLTAAIPFVEVHLSNPAAREDFRRHSYLADIAAGVISGFGADTYLLALQAVINRMEPSG